MLDYILFAFVGIIAGTVTGLLPGLHINSVALLVLSFFYMYSFDGVDLSIFILSMAITHSFVDFIPSIFLGVPDSNTVLSIQPGHRMLLRGRGFEALVLSVVGGLFGMVLVILLFWVLLAIVPVVYQSIRSVIPILLIVIVLYMIYIDRNRVGAFIVTLLSGAYGVILMNTHIISRKYVLFVMLTGLFGISTLLLSYKTMSVLPRQKTVFRVRVKDSLYGSFVGFIGGVVAGVLPGLGSSQSAILVQKIWSIKGMRKFIIALGSINTIAILISVLSLYMIGRARSGSAIVIEEILGVISVETIYLFFGIALFSTGLAAFITIEIGKVSARLIHKINYRVIMLMVLVSLFLVIFVYMGVGGLLICAVGTAIGILPNLFGAKKSLLLSSLIVPTILYLTGMDRVVLMFFGL